MDANKWNIKNLITACLIPVTMNMIHNICYMCVYALSVSGSSHSVSGSASAVSCILCILIFLCMYRLYFSSPLSKIFAKKDAGCISFLRLYSVSIKASKKSIQILTITVISCTILGIALQIFFTGILTITDIYIPYALESYHQMVNNSFNTSLGWLRIFSVVLLSPVAEELAFRLFGCNLIMCSVPASYKRHTKVWLSIFTTALLFGLYHGNIVQFIYAAVAGIIFGFIAFVTSSVIFPILAHISVNTAAYLPLSILYITKERTAIFTVLSLIIIVSVMYIIRNIWTYGTQVPSHQDRPDTGTA